MKNYPVRMCIACRNRESQHALIRIQFDENQVLPYKGHGRSWYLCHRCSHNAKRMKSVSKRFKIDVEEFLTLIKELETDG